MKIGLITGEYPPQQGGVGDFTRELARALIAAGHEAQVITGCSEAGCRMQDRRWHRCAACDQFVGSALLEADCRQSFSANSFDVLNIQYEPAAYGMQVGVNFLPSAWARRQIKLPIVTTFHDLLVPYLFPKAGPLRWKVVEYLARHSDAVIVTNGEDHARLSKLQ